MEFKMSDKVYNTLKWISQIVLPAIATLYFTIGSIWGLPYVKEVEGTIAAVEVFLGTILGISTANYKANLALEKKGGINGL